MTTQNLIQIALFFVLSIGLKSISGNYMRKGLMIVDASQKLFQIKL